MIGSEWELKCDVPESRFRVVRMTGTGTTPTKNIGHGVTITRQGAGDYKVTFSEFAGTYCGCLYSLESATMTDLKNFSLIAKNYDSTNRVVEVTLFNSSGTATDLAANQQITLFILMANITSSLT